MADALAEKDELLTRLGQLLIGSRKAYGWSLSEAARQTGVAKSELWKLERGIGNPRMLTLVKIKMAFRSE